MIYYEYKKKRYKNMKNIKYLETKIGKIELQEENGYIIWTGGNKN